MKGSANFNRASTLSDHFRTLYQAQDVIRTSRHPRYFTGGDYLCSMWAETLGITHGVDKLSGTNLAVLDTLFEETASLDRLQDLMESLETLTMPDKALHYIHAPVIGELSLRDAAHLHVAFLTWEGFQQCHTLDEGLAYEWLGLWQTKVQEFGHQFFQQAVMIVNADDHYPDADTFESGAVEYATRFGETGALSLAIVGAFPFSKVASRNLLLGVAQLLDDFVPLFRLAQDVRVDRSEKLNTGIYAYAADSQISIGEAYRLFQDGDVSSKVLENQMLASWQRYLADTQATTAYILSGYMYTKVGQILGDLSMALFQLTHMLTHPWKEVTPA